MVRPKVARPHAGGEGARGAQELQRGGRHEDVAHLVPGQEVKRLAGIELARAVCDHGDSVVPGGQEHVEQPADPRPVRGRPEAIARLREAVVRVLDAREVAEEDAVRVQRSLRLARGARSIDDDRRVLGRRRNGVEPARGALERGGQIDGALAGPVRAEDQAQLGQALAKPLDLRQLVPVGDDRARAAVLQPELQGLLAEQLEERDRDQARLVHGDVGDRGLLPLRQEDRDAVAARQPVRDQHVGEPVRQLLDRRESELGDLPRGLDLDERRRSPGGGMAVHDGYADVEPLRDRPLVTGPRPLVHVVSAARAYGQAAPSPVNSAENTTMPSHRFRSRRFSFAACWLLSWFTMGTITTGFPSASCKVERGTLPPRMGRRTMGPIASATTALTARAKGWSMGARTPGYPAFHSTRTMRACASRAGMSGSSCTTK